MTDPSPERPKGPVARVKRNAIASGAQVVISGLGYVLLYHFLLQSLGDRAFGIWALLLAVTSVSNIANLGLASACVPYVANDLSKGDKRAAASTVSTATVTVAGLLLIMLLVMYPVADAILPSIARDPAMAALGIEILPLVLLSLWFASIGSVFLAAIDGCQRMDIRSVILVLSMCVYLGGAFALVPQHGLAGVALAHVGHTFVLLVLSWVLLRKQLGTLPVLPFRWSRTAFRRIYRYGAAMQLISVAQLVGEPVVKSLISVFGGLGMVSMYEFASRMAVQLRGIVASSHRAVLPAIAAIEDSPAMVRRVFVRSYGLLQSLVVVALPWLILSLPIVSELWVGRRDPFFVFTGATLLVAWFLSLLAGPAYYGFLGAGRARWPTLGHGLTGLTTVTLGAASGVAFGPRGVVVASCIAILMGQCLIAYAYRRIHNLSVREMWAGRPSLLALYAGAAFVAAWSLAQVLPATVGSVTRYGLALAAYATLMFVPIRGRNGLADILSVVIKRTR